MDHNPDLLVITAHHEEDIVAERAELLVTVKGSSLVTVEPRLEGSQAPVEQR